MLPRLFVAALTLSPAVLSPAVLGPAVAAAETREDGRMWVNVTGMGSVSGRLIYFAEVQTRTRDGARDNDQLLLRPAVGWRLSPKLSLYQGYARVITNPVAGRDRFEDRSFQQLSWAPGRIGPGDVSIRARLEQRWLEDGRDTGWRARAMLRYRLPLRADARGVRLLTYAEPFVALNATDWGQRRGFDQLRSFAGVELPVGGASTAELGYLNQLVDRGAGVRDMNHVAAVAVFLRP